MSSLAHRFSLVVLLVLLAAMLPAARPAYALTFTVTSTDDVDDGGSTCPEAYCTLRKAIRLANQNAGNDTITFNIAGTGPHIINVVYPNPPPPAASDPAGLPSLSGGGTTIEVSPPHSVVLNGGSISRSTSAFGLQITSANNVVRGLVIIGFPGSAAALGGSGIALRTPAATGNLIANNWIGLADSTSVFGNDFYGVLLDEGASNNQIGSAVAGEGNVIVGNKRANIAVDDSDTSSSFFITGNQIVKNYIGINPAGTTIPTGVIQDNLAAGVFVGAYARSTVISGNRIGGHTGNSGNAAAGIVIESPDGAISSTRHPRDTVIIANDIGVTPTGGPIANRNGIRISRGAINTMIGNPDDPVGGRNVIGFSQEDGIQLANNAFTISGTRIVGNYIGIARDEITLAPIGSVSVSGYHNAGIFLGTVNDTSSTLIGPANLIASVRRYGIVVRSSNNVIKGNLIGTNPAGTASSKTSATDGAITGFGVGDAGIWVEDGSGNQIGGPDGGDRNVIATGGGSFTGAAAAIVIMPGTGALGNCRDTLCSVSQTLVQGNYLGVSAKGDAALNTSTDGSISSTEGLRITNSSDIVNPTAPAHHNSVIENVISGVGTGITILRGANNNIIDGNLIGTRASGNLTLAQAIRNNQHGINLLQGTNNQISNNIIAFNGKDGLGSLNFYGINISNTSTGANSNTISGNRLVGNGGDFATGSGIYISKASSILITRTTTSSHRGDGIKFDPANPGNGNILAPTLTGVSGIPTNATLSGSTTCSSGNCTIEVFTSSVSEDREGPVYLASASTAGGSFSMRIDGCMQYLTATLRDNVTNNTSPFSVANDSVLTDTDACIESGFSLGAASPNTSLVNLGGVYTYTHSISNSAPIARTFTVVITSTQGWASAPTMVTVPATSSAPFDLIVSVPYTAKVTPTPDVDTTSVQVFVGTKGSNVVSDITTAKDNTPTPATPDVSPGQTKARTGPTLTFTHTVTNTGQVTGIFSVTGPSGSGLPTFVGTPPTGWTILSASLGQSSLTKGASTSLTIVVQTDDGALALPVQFSFIVKAASGSSIQTSPVIVDTITVPVVRSFDFTAVAPTSASSPPGAPLSFTYTITNTGNASDSFLITPPTNTTPVATPLPITAFSANPSGSFVLAARTARTVTVTAQIPSDTNALSYGFIVSAKASDGSGATKIATGTIIVTGGGAPLFVGTANVSPSSVAAGGQATITHTVRNSGNLAVPFSFGVASLPGGWTLQSQTNTCPAQVPTNGSTCTVTTVVNVPVGADGTSYNVGVSATADNGTSGTSPEDVTVSASATVNVTVVRGVSLSTALPSATQSGTPGTVLTFTHTLTNTGNAPDSFTLTLTPTPPATLGMAVLNPTSFISVPRNTSRTVTLMVTVPSGLPASNLDFVITATSQGDPTKTAARTDTATINTFDGASLTPGSSQSGLPGVVLTFTHTLTNTGSTTTAYDISASNSHPSFAPPVIVSGSTTPVLSPGQSTTISIQVTLPVSVLGGTSNITTIQVRKAGGSNILATATDESLVGNTYNVLITPDRSGTGYPSETLVFTHTVKNVGVTLDTYTITATNSLAWPISVSPDIITLTPGTSQEIAVSISVPNDNGTLAGSLNFARIRVVSNSNPITSNDEAVENITVGKVIDLVVSADQARAVTPSSGTIQMRPLVLSNNGNGSDTVDFTVLGADSGWGVTIAPFDVLGAHDTDYNVSVKVTVPADVVAGPTKVITIQARSRYNQNEVAEVRLRFVYIAPVVPITYRAYLPMINN